MVTAESTAPLRICEQCQQPNPRKRAPLCHVCRRKNWRVANPGYMHAYYMANVEHIRLQHQVYNAAHVEEKRAYRKAYNAANREERRARNAANKAQRRAYNAANAERKRQQVREWRKKNPESAAASKAKSHARRRGSAINNLTAAQWRAIKEHYGHRCVYCGKKMQRLTQDHIIPLSKGGTHTVQNVVLACLSCNSQKHVGPPLKPVQPLLLV